MDKTSTQILTQEEKQQLCDRIYRLTNELSRAVVDAAHHNIHVIFIPGPPLTLGNQNIGSILASVFERVDYVDPTKRTEPDSSNASTDVNQ